MSLTVSKYHSFQVIVQTTMQTNYEAVIFARMLHPGEKKWQMGTNRWDVPVKINI